MKNHSPGKFWRLMLAAGAICLAQLAVSQGICQSNLQSSSIVKTSPYTVVPVPRTDYWWMPRHQKLVKRARQGIINVVFFGDSITALMNVQLLHNIIGPHAENFGISGDGTQHLLWRLQNGELDFTGTPPDVAVILIGTNNIRSIARLSASGRHAVFLGVQANVDQIRKKLPSTKILVLGVLPREQSATHPIRAEIGKINHELQGLADNQHVCFADIGAAMLEPDGSLSRQVMHDLLHPTWTVGYTRMFNAVKPYVDALVSGRATCP
jgi:lysophospholipase L1-like esterase